MPAELKGANPREQDGVTVIFKNPDMSEGLSDLPWHRDCGMGGHAIMCPTVIISIYLYDATDEAGALRFLPASHKASFGFLDAGDSKAPRGVRADARAGSVTLHYGDVMHAAPEPTAPLTAPVETLTAVPADEPVEPPPVSAAEPPTPPPSPAWAPAPAQNPWVQVETVPSESDPPAPAEPDKDSQTG